MLCISIFFFYRNYLHKIPTSDIQSVWKLVISFSHRSRIDWEEKSNGFNELLIYENSQIHPAHRQMQARDRIGLPNAVRRAFVRHVMFRERQLPFINNVPRRASPREANIILERILFFAFSGGLDEFGYFHKLITR